VSVASPAAPADPAPALYRSVYIPSSADTLVRVRAAASHGCLSLTAALYSSRERSQDRPALRRCGDRRHPPRSGNSASHGVVCRLVQRTTDFPGMAERTDWPGMRRGGGHRLRSHRRGVRSGHAPMAPCGPATLLRRRSQTTRRIAPSAIPTVIACGAAEAGLICWPPDPAPAVSPAVRTAEERR
jgi:hypothetical protein